MTGTKLDLSGLAKPRQWRLQTFLISGDDEQNRNKSQGAALYDRLLTDLTDRPILVRPRYGTI